MPELYPPTLPHDFMLGTEAGSMGDGRVRANNDTGPASMRLDSLAVPDTLSGVLTMTAAELAELKTFVRETIRGGTLPFLFPDQQGGDDLLVRFVSLPNWARAGVKFRVEFKLEIMP